MSTDTYKGTVDSRFKHWDDTPKPMFGPSMSADKDTKAKLSRTAEAEALAKISHDLHLATTKAAKESRKVIVRLSEMDQDDPKVKQLLDDARKATKFYEKCWRESMELCEGENRIVSDLHVAKRDKKKSKEVVFN